MTRKYSAHRISFDLLAPLYDLGVWLFALPAGGEEKFREAVIKEVAAGAKAGAGVAVGLEGKRVLEIFAGTSSLSLMAAGRGATAVSIDISRGMVATAVEKARRSGTSVGLVRGDASGTLPFADGAFDGVMAALGLHEIEQEMLPTVFSEVRRVLKKGGSFTIFDFHRAEGRAAWLQKAFFTFAEGENARKWITTDIQGLAASTGFRNFRRKFLNNRFFQIVSMEKNG